MLNISSMVRFELGSFWQSCELFIQQIGCSFLGIVSIGCHIGLLQTQARVIKGKAKASNSTFFDWYTCNVWTLCEIFQSFLHLFHIWFGNFIISRRNMGRKGLFAEKPKKGPGRKAKKQGPPVLSRQFKGKSFDHSSCFF